MRKDGINDNLSDATAETVGGGVAGASGAISFMAMEAVINPELAPVLYAAAIPTTIIATGVGAVIGLAHSVGHMLKFW